MSETTVPHKKHIRARSQKFLLNFILAFSRASGVVFGSWVNMVNAIIHPA